MNILVVGSGGREHALAWKILQSPLCSKLYVAPGNAGTANIAENLSIAVTDFEAIANACLDKNIHLVVVGPEEPLVKGIADFFEKDNRLKNILIVAPNQQAAQLEGSKKFSKDLMLKYGIPTAAAQTFDKATITQAKAFLREIKPPYVLKADGLAAGKGVIITNDLTEAEQTIDEMLLQDKFGKAGNQVLIEEFLSGIELSVFILTDGKSYVLLPEAKDYKRIGVGDTGLNTGGMGAVSPVPFADATFMQKITERIIEPTLKALQAENITYKGFIFFGLINVQGNPFVIEYNARLGDPETEAILPRIESDFVDLLIKTAKGELHTATPVKISTQIATTVISVAGGYPAQYEKDKVIIGLERVKAPTTVFHAGTKLVNGKVVTNGGRVLAFTTLAATLPTALAASKNAAETVTWDGRYYRSDIGLDLV